MISNSVHDGKECGEGVIVRGGTVAIVEATNEVEPEEEEEKEEEEEEEKKEENGEEEKEEQDKEQQAET